MSEKFFLRVNLPEFDGLVGDELIGFSYIESMGGCARWAMSFDTQENRRYDPILKYDEFEFTLRYGTSMPNTDGSFASKLKRVRVLRSKKWLGGNARVIFNLRGTCAGVRLQRHRSKDKHWKNTRISGIVQDLIDEIGLKHKVASTEGFFSLMGCNLPTGRFIDRHLLPLAYNQQAGRDWRFWVEDGQRVHFEPTRPNGILPNGFVKPYYFTNLYREDWFKLKSPRLIKDNRFDPQLNTGKIEVMMFDSDRDRLVRKTIGENTGGFNYFGRGRPLERRQTSHTKVINYQQGRQTTLNPDQLTTQVGRTLWGQHGRSLYRIMGELEFAPGISINHLAFVELSGPFDIPDVNTGFWVVHSVKHLYSRGDVKTWVVLEKRWER